MFMTNIDKKPLYVFLHLNKTGGTTITDHIVKNLPSHKFLLLYPDFKNKSKIKTETILKSLSFSDKNNLKVIIGHQAYYGIHKFFPQRDVRYVTILRDPIKRIVSQYNYRRARIDSDDILEYRRAGIKKDLFVNGAYLGFREWIERYEKVHNFGTKQLGKFFFQKHCELSKQNITKIKKILKTFYFIGLTENKEDFSYILSIFGVTYLYPPSNVNKKKYYVLNDADLKMIKSEFVNDQEIYDFAKDLNRRFKEKHHKSFKRMVCRLEKNQTKKHVAFFKIIKPLVFKSLMRFRKCFRLVKKVK